MSPLSYTVRHAAGSDGRKSTYSPDWYIRQFFTIDQGSKTLLFN